MAARPVSQITNSVNSPLLAPQSPRENMPGHVQRFLQKQRSGADFSHQKAIVDADMLPKTYSMHLASVSGTSPRTDTRFLTARGRDNFSSANSSSEYPVMPQGQNSLEKASFPRQETAERLASSRRETDRPETARTETARQETDRSNMPITRNDAFRNDHIVKSSEKVHKIKAENRQLEEVNKQLQAQMREELMSSWEKYKSVSEINLKLQTSNTMLLQRLREKDDLVQGLKVEWEKEREIMKNESDRVNKAVRDDAELLKNQLETAKMEAEEHKKYRQTAIAQLTQSSKDMRSACEILEKRYQKARLEKKGLQEKLAKYEKVETSPVKKPLDREMEETILGQFLTSVEDESMVAVVPDASV
eukprot:Platyproteum_vivax@DN7283_c0_g2_i2.p1